MKSGKCPKGQYYCHTDKKCKEIPAGLKMAGKYLGGGREPEEVGIDKPLEGGQKNGNGSGESSVSEANKSGDSSLRDWFTKSRASDGTPGWVQLGGKYAGKPCAKQPGQTTKPKCGSSKMKRALSKDEEEAAFRRKNRKDPNPERRGKAINVATEETKKDHEYSMARSEVKTIKNAAKRLEKKMGKKGEGNLQAWVQSKITKAADYIDTAADYVTNEEAGQKDSCYHKVKSRYSVWPSAYASGALVKCRKFGAKNWGNKTKKEEFSNWREELLDESGKKCWKGYKKAGTQKLFGKTYNRCVKEEMTCSHTEEGTDCPIHGMKVCPSPKLPKGGDGGKIGLNKNYVKPMGEDIELTDAYGNTFATIENIIEPQPMKATVCPRCGQNPCICSDTYDIESMTEATRIPAKTGNIINVSLSWRGKYYGIRMFFPSIKMPSRSDIQNQIDKVYPGAKVSTYYVSEYEPGQPFLHAESAAWTRKEGKNKSGGLNEKGRKSYEKENPGSDLKAPSKKVGNPRRASFCARMKGMKKKLTSTKTASDPNSRINKSLRAWNC